MRFAGTGISVVAMVMLLLVALAPQAAFGLTGQGCICADSVTGNACGQEGFVCHCCQSEAQSKLTGVPLIKDCHSDIKSFSTINPPALVGQAGEFPIYNLAHMLLAEDEPSINDEFTHPPLRPPRIHPI